MFQWNKVTWYSQVTAILLVVLIFCGGFYVGSVKTGKNDGDQIIGAYSEVARLGTDGAKVKILTGTILNTRNIVFQNELNDQIIDVVTVTNDTVSPPDYRIVRGNNQDWLVVTKIEQSGTGYIAYTDVWYTLSEGTKKVLTYRSKSVMSPYPFSESQFNEHLNTEVSRVSADDQLINIQTTKKICEQTTGGEDGPCTESTYEDKYQWNSGLNEFSKAI